jgi:exopolyphosphatase/guanosine-5'-triphosphate,3'-diphosphate pyrophosphatase
VTAPADGGTSRLSVLDLGSNSFHVLIADARPDGGIVPVGREREMLHLGAVVQRHGHVPDGDRARAVDTVTHLTELAARLGATRRLAVATSALRDAANGAEVIAEMEAAAQTEVRVLDGPTEAALAYRGVRASVALDDEPVMVMDLGGGSLEFAVGTGNRIDWSTSLDLGVSRLSTHLDQDPPSAADVKALRRFVRTAVKDHVATIRDLAPRTIVAVGGTIRALGRVVAAEHHDWLPATLNELTVPASAIADLRDRFVAIDAKARADVAGMKSKRADRIHVAAIIVDAVLDTLEVDGFVLSDWGLREGVLLDAMGVDSVPTPRELRTREIDRIVETFVPDDPHLPHVTALALQLFDGTVDLHGLGPSEREILEHAGRVHDVGEALTLRRHHHHGAYILEHAELRGFSPARTAMLCSIVRFHPSRGLSDAYPPVAALSPGEREHTERLVALLQLADGLDRARDQAVTGLHVEVDDDAVTVHLHGDGLHVARTEFERKAAMFQRVFGRRVRLADNRDLDID